MLRTKLELVIFSTATWEFDAVFFASKVYDNFVAVLSSTLDDLRLSKTLSDAIQDIFDIVFGNGLNNIFCIKVFIIAEDNFWHNICLNRELCTLARNIFHNINVRDGDRRQFCFGEDFWNGLANQDI